MTSAACLEEPSTSRAIAATPRAGSAPEVSPGVVEQCPTGLLPTVEVREQIHEVADGDIRPGGVARELLVDTTDRDGLHAWVVRGRETEHVQVLCPGAS